ncbi:hypothetical protein ACLOJK_017251 [Asimina triloba]
MFDYLSVIFLDRRDIQIRKSSGFGCRHCLWIVGNRRTLMSSDSIWKEIVINAEGRKCSFDAKEDKSLAKAIKDANDELVVAEDLAKRFASLHFRKGKGRRRF